MALLGDMLRGVAAEEDPRPDPLADKPVEWVGAKLGEHLTCDERRILESLADHDKVAVQSAHDMGKSFSGARAVGHFVDTHKPHEVLALTTAPTDAQVKTILWGEIADVWRKGQLRGRITLDARWLLDQGDGGPAKLMALGRKPAEHNISAFQGYHRRYQLVVIDEAGGVPKAIFDGVDTITTGRNAKILAIGNPDDPASHFAQICRPGSGWHVIVLDGLASPNFTAAEVAKYPDLRRYMILEGVPPSTERVPDVLRDVLLSPKWVADKLKRWGPRSMMFIAKARGQFPEVSEDLLIEPRWVKAAMLRDEEPVLHLGRLGADPARWGENHSICVLRQGPRARVVVDIAKGPITEFAGEVMRVGWALEESYRPTANIDDSGIGGGVTDILAENRYPVLPLNGGNPAVEKLPNGLPRFVNARSEWWWHLRMALRGNTDSGENGYLDLDPDDEEMLAQLTNIKYGVNSKGQIWVESKVDMRERGVESPDRGDALAYSLVVGPLGRKVQRTERMVMADILSRQW